MPADGGLAGWGTALGPQLPMAVVVAWPLLLAALGALWWAAGRARARRRGAAENAAPSPPRLAWRLSAGFAVIVAAAALFAGTAEEIGAGEALGHFDEALAASISRSVSPGTLEAYALVTHFGDTLTLTVLGVGVGTGLFVARRRGLAVGWALAVGGNALLNTTLKGVFARVRPPHDNGFAVAEGFSFPSGHSSGSMVAYGMLAYLAICLLPRRWHLPAVAAAVSVVFLTGASRIVLQVHYFSDVAAGLASGAAWLTVCVLGCEWSRGRQARAA